MDIAAVRLTIHEGPTDADYMMGTDPVVVVRAKVDFADGERVSTIMRVSPEADHQSPEALRWLAQASVARACSHRGMAIPPTVPEPTVAVV